MSYTVEDYLSEKAREVAEKVPHEDLLKWIPIEARIRGLEPEELMKRIPIEARLKGLEPEELLKRVPIEARLEGLEPEERLMGLSGEDLEQLEKLLKERRARH